MITAIGTYLPRWGTAMVRCLDEDEDALTLGVAAGLAALRGVDPQTVRAVVLVTRDFPLLEGGNAAALLGGLGVHPSAHVIEQLGGAPAALDAVLNATDATLVIGADAGSGVGAGAGALLVGSSGVSVASIGRISRSMPVTTRDAMGHTTDYADPRLLRVRGLGASLTAVADGEKFTAVAGLLGRDASALCSGKSAPLATSGASAAIFALAALAESGAGGSVLAVEQAAVSAALLGAGAVTVHRDEAVARPLPAGKRVDGAPISISLSAYDRAFDAKLRLLAAKCRTCGTLAYPHRFRCLECGAEDETDVEVLPRDVEAHSLSTIYTPVPGLTTPYTVVLAELGDSGVRLLTRLTGAPAGSVKIGDKGTLVLRLVAIRSGVPDYGYSFLPDQDSAPEVGS